MISYRKKQACSGGCFTNYWR